MSRPMPLRQLLTHTEKSSRDLIEHLQSFLATRVTEFRDLSRPVRKRSSYPSMVAIRNSLKKLTDAGEETRLLAGHLIERLQEIYEHAQRENDRRFRFR